METISQEGHRGFFYYLCCGCCCDHNDNKQPPGTRRTANMAAPLLKQPSEQSRYLTTQNGETVGQHRVTFQSPSKTPVSVEAVREQYKPPPTHRTQTGTGYDSDGSGSESGSPARVNTVVNAYWSSQQGTSSPSKSR